MFLGTALYHPLLFDVLNFILEYFVFALKIHSCFVVDLGHSEQNTNLLVSGLKKMKGGVILFFFFCMFHSKSVHELGQESINCAVTHSGTNLVS